MDPIRTFAKYNCISTGTFKAPLISFTNSGSKAGTETGSGSGSTPISEGVGAATGAGDLQSRIKLSLNDLNMNMHTVQLPRIGFEFPDFNALIVKHLDELVTHNTQVLVIGASLGAAIAFGVAMALFSALSLVGGNGTRNGRERGNEYGHGHGHGNGASAGAPVPVWWRTINTTVKRWLRPNMEFDVDDNNNEVEIDIRNGDVHRSDENSSDRKDKSIPPRLQIMQGKPKSRIIIDTNTHAEIPTRSSEQSKPKSISASPRDQCIECLDAITISLAKHKLTWDQILRISVYLALNADDSSCQYTSCDASTFRQVLKEYPWNADRTVVSILYVQRLEDETACVEVEALVQSLE